MKVLVLLCFLVGGGCGGMIGANDDIADDDGGPDADPAIVPDADPDAPDADPTAPDANTSSCTGAPAFTIFVNNEGQVITSGFESAITNTSTIVTGSIDTTPVSAGAALAVIDFLETAFAFADPTIVTTRPANNVPYVMVVLNNDDSPLYDDFGAAPNFPDCEAHRGIAFVENTPGMPMGKKAVQGVGILMGLEWTTDSCMNAEDPSATCLLVDGAHFGNDPSGGGPSCVDVTQAEVTLLTAALGCQ